MARFGRDFGVDFAVAGSPRVYARQQRHAAEQAVLPERGAECLLIEADGGSVRTGPFVPCKAGDEGYREMVDYLLSQAFGHLPSPLPSDLDKCPVHALQTYTNNNWDSFRCKQMRSEGLPYVSARAESQVRDRTRTRFGGPGTWLEENLEPKATTLAIIMEGRWGQFEQWVHTKRKAEFRSDYTKRWRQAHLEGRTTREATATALAQPLTASTKQLQHTLEDNDVNAIADAA